jgi:formate hydrogenlyase transcriptional activator
MPPDQVKGPQRLAQLIASIVQAQDIPTLLSLVTEALKESTGCRRVRFLLPDKNKDIGNAAAVLSEQEQGQPRIETACLLLPLPSRGRIVGVLEITAQSEEQRSQWDRSLLDTLAVLLGLALDNLQARERIAELERFQRESVYLRDEIKTERDLRLLTGDSPAMKAVRLAVQQVARQDSTVLILGETGTGKELVARAIHQLSPRRERLLVTVNCAALAPGVIASELFGHEAGAFTGGTKRRVGRFELAQRGTIFLDEIGELLPETQMLLLRVLQERVIERVGGNEPIPVDVRVIAATHQDLSTLVKEGRFRADLFYRLNVFPIHVPPLRERREDIPDLVRHFLLHFSRRMGKPITRVSDGTLRLLLNYPWPGNVRELENLIERAMIVSTGETLPFDPTWLNTPAASGAASASLADRERQTIVDAVERCGGRIYGPDGAAALLGVKPTTLYGKMRKHHITRPRPRRSEASGQTTNE